MPDAMMVVEYLNCEKENMVNKSPSLIPWPPVFVLRFAFTRKWKSGKKQGRPGNTNHVNDITQM